jgi:hypothetical protein
VLTPNTWLVLLCSQKGLIDQDLDDIVGNRGRPDTANA